MYKFQAHKDRAVSLDEIPKPVETVEEQEQVGTIQGMAPMSVQEWRLAVALGKFDIQYEYQVQINSSRFVRGAQIVDFVAYVPFKVPIQVFGAYWHRGQLDPEETLDLAVIENYFQHEVVIFWDYDLASQSAADTAVKEKIAGYG